MSTTSGRTAARRRMLGTAAGLAALIASATACGAVAPSHSADAAESDRPISGVATFANLSRDHVPGAVAYEQVPPVGGAHSGVTLQSCGFYSSSVQDEYAVHSLEHGAAGPDRFRTQRTTTQDPQLAHPR